MRLYFLMIALLLAGGSGGFIGGLLYFQHTGKEQLAHVLKSGQVHIKGSVTGGEAATNEIWGLLVQNHWTNFDESTFAVREPLVDSGNRFSTIVGSGAASAVELAAVRDADGVRRAVGVDSSEWKFSRGGEATQLILNDGAAAIKVTLPSGIDRLLMDLQGNGASKFKVEQSGKLITAADIEGPSPFTISAGGPSHGFQLSTTLPISLATKHFRF